MSRMLAYLPPYERNSKVFQEILQTEEIEFDNLNLDIEDLEKQLNIDTATWGLSIYEKELGIKTNLTKSLDERRSVIKSKWRGTGKVDKALIKTVVDAYTNGGVDVNFDGKIRIKFNDVKGTPPNLEDAKRAIEDISPAHLAIIYEFAYLLIKEIHGVIKLNEIELIPLNKFAGGGA